MTDSTPAKPGDTYPMPPGPAWSATRRMEEDAVTHFRSVGTFDLEPVTNAEGEPLDPRDGSVFLSRWDTIEDDKLTVGSTSVCLLDAELSPGGARKLAALLVEAADLAES